MPTTSAAAPPFNLELVDAVAEAIHVASGNYLGSPLLDLRSNVVAQYRAQAVAALTAAAHYSPADPVADLDALHLGSVVQAYDGLAWQAIVSRDGTKFWANAQDGYEFLMSSAELLTANRDEPLAVLFSARF